MTLPFSAPSSLSPSFRMSPATAADLDALAESYYDAFKIDHGNTYWWPSDRGAMETWMKRRILKKMGDRRVRHFKVIDVVTSDLVAWARWDIPEAYDGSFGPWVDGQGDEIMGGGEVDVSRIVEGKDENGSGYSGAAESNGPVTSAPVEAIPSSAFDCPEGSNPELCRQFFDAIGAISATWGAKNMLGLSLLCTAPKYHRRGAAKALMLPMLAIADATGLKTYLEATPTGKPVYEKLGFEVVDEIEIDLRKVTEKYDELYKLSIMIREPKRP
ncbi:acyl-CoA N-acyltransferase [Biscogniauxia marginata]|nr:acyl-CoA N-acyltransferase [Biscogniauxia marginata]